MGFLGKLGKFAMNVIETPVAIVKDVATMGGVLTDQDDSYTSQKLEDIGGDWDEMKEELDK